MVLLFYLFIFSTLILWGLSFILPVDLGGVHGSASFAQQSILKHNNKGLVVDGIKRIPPSNSFTHTTVVASSGAGKTTRYILPNVLTLDNCSMVISDPKGEIADLTSAYLKRKGFKVVCLDFENLHNSIKFNPLARANTDAEIKQVASALYDMANAGTKSEGIWRMGAIRVLESMIQTLKHAPDIRLATISSVINLLNHIEDGTTRVKDFVDKYAPKDSQALFNSFSNQETKIKLGQLSSAQACLAPFDTKEIRQLTAKDTLDFQSFRKQKTVLFLKLPVGVSSRYAPVLSLLYTQFFHHLLNTKLVPTDLPIYFLMDEFANVKKIPDFPQIITMIRSKRVSLSLVIQAISQLDTVYGKDVAETILSNTSSLICYSGIREKRTLEYITQLMGTTTQEMHTPGSFGLSFFSRPLMTMDELRTMHTSRALFIHANRKAEKVRPIPLFRNKSLMAQANIASINGELVAIEPTEQVKEKETTTKAKTETTATPKDSNTDTQTASTSPKSKQEPQVTEPDLEPVNIEDHLDLNEVPSPEVAAMKEKVKALFR